MKEVSTKAEYQNIWVIQTAFLGDCVLSLPFLYRLAELNPKADIHLITAKGGFDIFKVALERGLEKFKERIHLHLLEKRGRHKSLWKSYKFVREIYGFSSSSPDIVYCLQRSARSGFLALASGAQKRVGFGSGSASFFYNHHVPRFWNNAQSEIEKNLDLLRSVHTENEISPWDTKNAPSLLQSKRLAKNSRTVAIALGSPWPTKRWPVENAASLATKLCNEGVEVYLLGDPSAKGLADELKKLAPSLLIKDWVGQTTIEDWVDKISSISVIVCNDSAATHVASDLGVPCITLFGPTLPDFGFAPWRRGSVALGVGSLECRPCDIHGPKSCPEGHHRCLKEISPETVHRHVFKLLQMG